MDNVSTPSPLTPAAFAYAGACIVALLALPHLAEPLRVYGAPNVGALLLGRDGFQGLLWGVAAGAASAAAGQGFTRWTVWGRLFARLLQRWLVRVHPFDALLLAALSSFGEELVFRGFVLPYLGLYASSALFGLAHTVPRRDLWPLALWAGVNGVALGALAKVTGGLLAPTVGHFVVNAVGLLLLSGPAKTETP